MRPHWIDEGLIRRRAARASAERDAEAARRRPIRRRRWLLTGASAFAGLLLLNGFTLGLLVRAGQHQASPDRPRQGTIAPPPAGATGAPSTRNGLGEPVAEVANALLPSVVQIETNSGLGSGVIYESNGLILTAAHVVDGATRVVVRLRDRRGLTGKVVGTDPATDIAVVRLNQGELRAAPIAPAGSIRVGQLAVAIGSPFGLESTVTAGVVSAVDRAIETGTGVVNMIQTDAPINPGNSGGALADREGRVIGINDSIRTNSGINEGVGFAIPIDLALAVAHDLVAGRTPAVGFLGVSGTQPSTGAAGALITDVEPGTPADDAGLKPGDLVTAVDGTAVRTPTELAARIRTTVPGTVVTLDVIRGGKHIQVKAQITQR